MALNKGDEVESHRDPVFAAVIAAGGSGSRFLGDALYALDLPNDKNAEAKSKQFLLLNGKPLYSWSLIALGAHNLISKIIVVTPSHMVQPIQNEINALSTKHNSQQAIQVISGGSSRQASVFLGLQNLAASTNPPDYVLVHDAARPFLDQKTVDKVIQKVIEYGACTVGGPVSDTIKRALDGKIIETIPRDDLISVQTPQAAKFNYLLRAHEQAALSGFATTDDAALLEWAGHDVYVVDGPKNNMKVTQPLDLMLAEALSGYLFNDHL